MEISGNNIYIPRKSTHVDENYPKEASNEFV